MRAGQLRHRVTLQQKGSVTQNEFGEEVISWTTVDIVWASVEPLRGREFIQAKQEQAMIDTKIRMRHRDGVTPVLRAVWNGRVYDILSVVRPEERQREIELMCREVL